MSEDTALVRRRVLLTILILPLLLIVGEVGSRIWVATSAKYPPERIQQLTTHATVRGRFASYPYLPYVLNPAFEGHNSLGFRGEEFEERKPAGARRIVCIGASTTYGSLLDYHDSYPYRLGELMAGKRDRWEVVNGGVLGWVSTEVLISLHLRILPLEPDVLVILPGRNEIVPQAYNGYRNDYTHFRRPGFSFAVSNYIHKELFKRSRLIMLACTVRGDRFGWSETEEHPLYGGNVWENQPTPAEVVRNLEDPARMSTFRRNLESMIEAARARGILVLMCTMQIRPEKFVLDEFSRDPQVNAPLGVMVERDNDVIREVSTRAGIPIVEIAKMSDRPELFLDDAHMTAEGHRVQARMIYDVLGPLLDNE